VPTPGDARVVIITGSTDRTPPSDRRGQRSAPILLAMASSAAEHALSVLASTLIQAGATEAELADEFAGLRIPVSRPRAREILEELARLGLARVGSHDGDTPRYVTTALGRNRLSAVGSGTRLHVQLAELERLRSELISAVAHELRTPLTTIRTSVGLLQDHRARPSERETERLLANIAASAERMQRFVVDVLDIARFRVGAVRLQLRLFDAADLAQDVARLTDPMLTAKGQVLRLGFPADPVPVYADRRRLEQVLVNLVSNASKFSVLGSAICLDVEPRNQDVVWSVRDAGPGIALADQAHLFEPFFTADRRSSEHTGTGLGLPISLAIAEAHRGTIEVETEVGHGSTFRLRVPSSSLSEDEPA
jgi:signal transduction histidine kinase